MSDSLRIATRQVLEWIRSRWRPLRAVWKAYPAACATGVTLLTACLLAYVLLSNGAALPIREPDVSYAAKAAYYSWSASAVALLALQVAFVIFSLGKYGPLLGARPMILSGALVAVSAATVFVFSLHAVGVATRGIEPQGVHQVLQAVAGFDIVCFIWARMGMDRLHAQDRSNRGDASDQWRLQLKLESAWLTVAAVQTGLYYRLTLESKRTSGIVDEANITEITLAMGILLSLVLAIGHLVPALYYRWRVPLPPTQDPVNTSTPSLWSCLSPGLGRIAEIIAPAVASFLLGFFGGR